jgi:hypothetical protein
LYVNRRKHSETIDYPAVLNWVLSVKLQLCIYSVTMTGSRGHNKPEVHTVGNDINTYQALIPSM